MSIVKETYIITAPDEAEHERNKTFIESRFILGNANGYTYEQDDVGFTITVTATRGGWLPPELA